ncbi:TIGR03364 family FAD-dependent oxidoreductase [Fulvivirgaceae bacterium BMA12]|uniref:TIGR03364 family FAD-dependent oxidoreductase n=1 Tax=Agaribacillus aureus TaxID=3051825 RepID=A0ABT8L7P6_9BACT|nr:TIGR03364 family FAD-dependent oxidoreductase [Fulvivirgaceae bacterium BMA12]
MRKKKAIVVGAGVVGLATARALALKDFHVEVFERNPKARGASVRNFGMVWPVGQPAGKLYERALRSRSIWKEMAGLADIWYGEVGSLHLAYRPEELAVIEEFANKNPQYKVLTGAEALQKSEAVVSKGLMGALWSSEELIVDPREAIAAIPGTLEQKYGVRFHWGKSVTEVTYPNIRTGHETHEADLIYICSGADFETLFPEEFKQANITKCKLQMMRLVSQPQDWKIGPALCGGITMVHYNSFKAMESHEAMRLYYESNFQDHLKWGLNVMVSQNGQGELTIGDSHEYGLDLEPFNKKIIDDMILQYLSTFAQFKDWTIGTHWNGVYSKMQDGTTEIVLTPQDGVTIINGLGGAGMTLSFGLAEEVIEPV